MCTRSVKLILNICIYANIKFVTEWKLKDLSRACICKFRVNFRVKFSRNSIN